MKKIISLILIISSLFVFAACDDGGDRTYNEQEVIAAAKNLIRQSEEYNDIFWGEGIRYVEDDNYSSGIYYPADPIHLNELGFKKVSDITDGMKKVYSEKYSKQITDSVFSSKVGNTNMAGFVRYYQDNDLFMVYSEYTPLLVDEVEYLYDTVKVLGSDGALVNIEITVKITKASNDEAEEAKIQERSIKISLIEEEGSWRIDSPTYARYREDLN